MSRRFTIDEHLILRIENETRDLASDCKWIPGLVLTEDDFKCQLFLRLLRLPGADQSYQSEDGLWASPVHAEVKWFDENKKLTLEAGYNNHRLVTFACSGVAKGFSPAVEAVRLLGGCRRD